MAGKTKASTARRPASTKAGNAELLRALPGGRAKSGAIDAWLRTHPDALSFIEDWMRLRRNGETFWSLSDLASHLKAAFAMPPFRGNSIGAWLDRNRPKQYRLEAPK